MVETQPRQFSDFKPLTPAERKVLSELDTGRPIVLGGGNLPAEDAGEDRRLRARFLRWVVLGCEGSDAHRLHESGLHIEGALIVGEGAGQNAHAALELEGAEFDHGILLVSCRIMAAPNLMGAKVQRLSLTRSHLPGSLADGLRTKGSVFLRHARSTGEVRLPGAQIGGNLDCTGATLTNPDGGALFADGANIGGAVFLIDADASGEVRMVRALIGLDIDCVGAKLSCPDGAALSASGVNVAGNVFLNRISTVGEIRLLGARIGGYLTCKGAIMSNPAHYALSADDLRTEGSVVLSGAEVSGEIRLLGARIGGDLDCVGVQLCNPSRYALIANRARVAGAFYLHAEEDRPVRIEGRVGLVATEIGYFDDDPGSWPRDRGSLALDRCHYGAFIGRGVSARERINWLALQDPPHFGKDFRPQPYEQCAKVFREMGYPEDARAILIEKERLQRAVLRRRLRQSGGWFGKARATGYSLWDGFLGLTIRYGRSPLRALWWLAGLWLLGVASFSTAWDAGQFKPNNPVVLRSAEWYGCAQSAPSYGYLAQVGESQVDCFLRQPQARGFPEFNASVYALDVLAPVVELEQQKHWVPDEDQWGGRLAKGWLYIEIVMGWLLSLLAVAGLSGLIRSD